MNLRQSIADQTRLIDRLERRVHNLQQELAAFQADYNRIIKPRAAKLEAIEGAIQDLREARYRAMLGQRFSDDYMTVDEQYRRAWATSPDAGASTSPAPHVIQPESDIKPSKQYVKKLYRRLARQFHPDFATDPEDEAYRTQMMIEINAAYHDEDYDRLQAFFSDDSQPSVLPPQPKPQDEESRLLEHYHKQQHHILYLKQLIKDLENGELRQLQTEVRVAKLRGRDLLTEIATDLDEQYSQQLRILTSLQGQN